MQLMKKTNQNLFIAQVEQEKYLIYKMLRKTKVMIYL